MRHSFELILFPKNPVVIPGLEEGLATSGETLSFEVIDKVAEMVFGCFAYIDDEVDMFGHYHRFQDPKKWEVIGQGA